MELGFHIHIQAENTPRRNRTDSLHLGCRRGWILHLWNCEKAHILSHLNGPSQNPPGSTTLSLLRQPVNSSVSSLRTRDTEIKRPKTSHTHNTSSGEPEYLSTWQPPPGASTIVPLPQRNPAPKKMRFLDPRKRQGYQNTSVERSETRKRSETGRICWGLHTLAIDKRLLTRRGEQNPEERSPCFIWSKKIS